MRGVIRGTIVLISLAGLIVLSAAQAYMYERYPSRVGEWGTWQLMRISSGILKMQHGDASEFARLQKFAERRVVAVQQEKVNLKEEALRTICATAKGFDLGLVAARIVPPDASPLVDFLVKHHVVPKKIAEAKLSEEEFLQ